MRGVYLASVWLHILAAMTWVGGMVVFVAAVMPYFRLRADADKAAFLDWFGPRFRLVSWIAFSILIVTGSFNLWARGVGISDLLRAAWWTTPFGRVFAVKLTLVIAAIAISSTHERMAARGARWLGRALLFVGLAIVAAAVMLVRTI